MNALLTDLSNENAVWQALEANMSSYWLRYGELAGSDVVREAHLQRFATPVAHPLFNAIFNAQLTISQIDPAVEESAAYFRTPFFWWTGPATRPSDLGDHLRRHGLRDVGGVPGMALELARLPESVPVLDAFEIAAVDNSHRLRQWVELAARANDIDPDQIHNIYELENARGLSGAGVAPRYLGLLNGEAVACAQVWLAAGVAGIYNIATLESARGRGLGRAMTLKACHEGRAAGYHVAILQASRMGYPLYQKMGFRRVCDLRLYLGGE
ncbi:MAG: GNAT family N-acetyltransferase [Chloroflexi bacterium]|nr:GNAT family N-acetyltransferase [Chloroflexota bacterium]